MIGKELSKGLRALKVAARELFPPFIVTGIHVRYNTQDTIC